MAIGPSTARSTSSTATGKKPKPRPQQKRTFHFFLKVTDESGAIIPGAKLHVERIISDARKVIEFMDTPEYATLGLTRVKHEVIANKRGGEDDGATSVG
jgi:hypothetical protein